MLRLKRKRKPEPSPVVLADRARDAGEWALAARHYREALARNPGQPAIWVQYGHALKEAGNLQEAEEAYKKSIALADRVADTHLQLGHLLKMRGRRDEAAAAYLRALAVDPAISPAAAALLALCWEPIARLEAAWRLHSPAFLNCIASVGAFAHEQARLVREIEQLRADLDRIGGLTILPQKPGGTPLEAEPAAEKRDGEGRPGAGWDRSGSAV
jgi:tetratricopeptide (TPR) repeat protein